LRHPNRRGVGIAVELVAYNFATITPYLINSGSDKPFE